MDKRPDRRYAKAKRRWKDERQQAESTSKPIGSAIDANIATTSNLFKRKNDDCMSGPSKRPRGQEVPSTETVKPQAQGTKFSANDRLKKYRKILDEKKQLQFKVHKVLLDTDPTAKPSTSSAPAERQKVSIFSATQMSGEHADNPKVDSLPVRESAHFTFTMPPSIDNDDDCDMDWSPIREEEVVSDIQKLRQSIKEQPNPSYGCLSPQGSPPKPKSPGDRLLYIIVDTNIFISHLAVIKEITKILKYDEYKPVVYVPWMVIQELDYFKDGRTGSGSMQNSARRAVAFINEMLTNKNKALRGQTVHEAVDHKFSNANADDSILFCCMQLRQNNERMMLLSNDVHLRNKALINDIEAYGSNCILEKIKEMCQTRQDGKVEAIKTIFLNTCSEIVKTELEQAYGPATYNMISRPPWTLKECLRYLKRFWSPVFSLVISQKQCGKAVDDLLKFVQDHREIREEEVDEFVKLVLCICVYFKNCLIKHNDMVKSCINQIQQHLS